MTNLKAKIQSLSEDHLDTIVDIRRHIHANPELSFQEFKTADYIESTLRKWGFEKIERKANTGLCVELSGQPGGKTIALRADIDALPITEENDVPYKSKNEGIMHACGHDVHTASLLGSAKILSELRNEFSGSVRLIFQPGEEKAPGGASLLIKEGVLENPKPSAIVGQHVMPLLDVGKIGFRSGQYMASADELYFTVKGKGGHGAMPEFATDPVVITSHIILGLQQIVSRMASPKMPTVLTFGRVEALGATNVIPNEVKVQGTFRTFDEDWRKQAKQRMKQMAEGIAASMGATCEFTIVDGYPYLYNDEEITAAVRAAATEYVGEENIVDLDLWMAAEDFAYYSQAAPACFYRLGVRNESQGIVHNVHTPKFNIDETALKTGMGLMAWIALKQLSA